MQSYRRIVASGKRICVSLLAASLATWPAFAHPEIEAQIATVSSRIAEDPENAELYLRRGELHRIHQDWAASDADFLLARKVEPEWFVVDFHQGRMKLDAGLAAEAKVCLDRFLEQSPGHVEGLVTRARAQVALGRSEEAARDFTLALSAPGEQGRPRPTFYLERARVLESMGRLDSAVRGLDEGLARLGQPVTLQLYAIELELSRGRHDAALTRLDRIAAQSSRKEAWLVRRGEILELAGRGDEARTAYAGAMAAIESLPATRRGNRAVRELETSAQSALDRLPPPVEEVTGGRSSLQ